MRVDRQVGVKRWENRQIVVRETEMAAEIDGEHSHPQCIKLPPAVEVFANLKNAQTFAIDIGMLYN